MARSPKVPGGRGERERKALPQRPGSPCLAGYQCMGRGGGGKQDKNSFDKAASLETLPPTWQRAALRLRRPRLLPGKPGSRRPLGIWILQLPIIKSK